MRRPHRRALLGCVAALSLQLVGGCGGSSGSSTSSSPSPSLTITGLGWTEESIDPSYWSTPPAYGQTAFYDFWIHYSGDIAFGDIQYARVYLPGGSYWNIAGTAQRFDGTNLVIGGWGRWYWTQQPGVLPIGQLRVEVKLNDGFDATYTANIPAPASMTAGAYTTMHSEDVAFPPPGSAPMIRRAMVGPTQTVSATGTITVTFSVDDANVRNGYAWFYDASNNYVGGFFYFADPATGLASAHLAGSTLHTDGAMNTLTVQPGDLVFAAGGTLAQFARVRIVLTDGGQYGLVSTGKPRYDCRSISAVAPLTLQ